MKEYITNSYDETVALAEKLAADLPAGAVIAFTGGLGMGKTAFTTGLVKGLGIDAEVTSPTFTICNTYIGDTATLHHYDMYRIDGWDDLYSTGFFDCLDSGAYIAVEWSENIYGALPDDAVIVDISRIDDNSRKIRIFTKFEEE
jgi:tRNA threonylcarbamoyladenosine biosynthesis protein TsaE